MSGYTQDQCCTPGCTNMQVVIDYNYCKSGEPGYRRWCTKCHNDRTAAKHGLKNIAEVCAKNAGFDNVQAYLNSSHPYRKHRKDYCENRDGRLSFAGNRFVCRVKIRHPAQLQVDHIDGNPSNNDPKNLQTLCANCHIFKTHWFSDGKTAGRKTLKAR